MAVNAVTTALSSSADVRKQTLDQTRKITRGNDLDFEMSKSSDLKSYGPLLLNQTHNTKMAELAKSKLHKLGLDVDFVGDLALSLDSIAAVVSTGLPLTNEGASAASAEAHGALEKIALILNEFTNVNLDAVRNQSNIEADGTFNADYVLQPTSTNFIELIDGKKLDAAVVPESFKNLIGALNLILRETRTFPLPENISDQTKLAYKQGFDDVVQILSQAKNNYDVAGAVHEEANQRVAESKDDMEKITDFNISEASQILNDAKVASMLLRSFMLMTFKFEQEVMQTVASAA